MAESRGKKGKKAQWQVVLGLKQVIFGAFGLAWVLMIIFVLGVLAGRGDVYRWMTNWGLLAPEIRQVAQCPPVGEGTPPGPPQTQAANAPAGGPSHAAGPVAAAVAGAAGQGAPVTASITSLPGPAAASTKKNKGIASQKEKKAREDEVRRTRRDVSRKLKFLNSFDTPSSKPAHKSGAKEKEKQKAAAAKTQPTQARVGKFRDQKAARDKMAELQKKGEKVTLKQGKDQNGAYYEVLRQSTAASAKSDKLAQNATKTGSSKSKPAAPANR